MIRVAAAPKPKPHSRLDQLKASAGRWRASEGVRARPPQHLLLNSIEKHKGFVYDGIAWDDEALKKTLLIGVRPRTGSRGHCSGCGGYPRLPRLRAASHRLPEMRCHRRDGAVGRWRAPAHTHLHLVSLAVGEAHVVERRRRRVPDELGHGVPRRRSRHRVGAAPRRHDEHHRHRRRRDPLAAHRKRLIWIGENRSEESLNAFFRWLGKERAATQRYSCSDMWKPYNWFHAKGRISAGAVNGLNNKAKTTTKKAYGFRTYKGIRVAYYHALGDLPEPGFAHRFC